MRFYYRPPGSPIGMSTGSIGALIIGALWLVVIVFYTFFIWPFQFIWVGLPQLFPRSKNLQAWQIGLSLTCVGLLLIAIIAGSNAREGSGSGSPVAVPAQPPPPSAPRGSLAWVQQTEQANVGSAVSVKCVQNTKTYFTCNNDDSVNGPYRTYYLFRPNGTIKSSGTYTPGLSPRP